MCALADKVHMRASKTGASNKGQSRQSMKAMLRNL